GAAGLLMLGLIEAAPVGQAGQRIAERQQFQFRTGVLQRLRRIPALEQSEEYLRGHLQLAALTGVFAVLQSLEGQQAAMIVLQADVAPALSGFIRQQAPAMQRLRQRQRLARVPVVTAADPPDPASVSV